MLFNSYIFIFAFLPLCIIGYYMLRRRYAHTAKVWLIAFSLWFYGYFNISYLAIMVLSVLGNYLLYRCMSRYDKLKKKVFILGIIANLAVLFYFKYFDFFIGNVNVIFKSSIPLKGILLPLGISFFTFQQISFLHDSYRGEMQNVGFVDYALFVTFFPQLIAGPIVTGEEMLPQFRTIGERPFDEHGFARGIYIFVIGLAKKVLLADTFAGAVDYGYSAVADISSTEAVLVILFYTLQLYFDFSGYCDMAIGIGKMLGFDIALNFNSPYKSGSITEFWKRWHITLNRFFTKNIYIPLGGNRKGKLRMYANLLIVFFLSGLWHGAGWNYVLWGCMHGLLYVITRAWQRTKQGKTGSSKPVRAVSILLTFIFINVAWVFFRAADVSEALQLFDAVARMKWVVPGENFAEFFNLGEFWYVLKILHLTDIAFGKYLMMIIFTLAALVIVFFMPNVHEMADKTQFKPVSAILTALVFIWCVVSLSGVSTFLYFNF